MVAYIQLPELRDRHNLDKMMSRSFLVDSLILKKSSEPVGGFSPPRSPYTSSAPGHSPADHQRAASDHALHALHRPPGGSMLDVCCPWCPPAVSMLPVSLPSSGALPLVEPVDTTSSIASMTLQASGLSASHPVFSVPHRPPLGTLSTPSAFSATEPQSHHPLRSMDPRRIRYMNLGKF